MQDNFNLKNYLRHDNKLLNEGIGGYMDLKPLNELEGDSPMGTPDTDDENPWMEDVDGTEAYTVGEWKCYYDHPGVLVWSYSDVPFEKFTVYATPAWEDPNVTPIQVDVDQETVGTMSLPQGIFANFNEYAAAMQPKLDQIERDHRDDISYAVTEGEPEGDQYDGEYDAHTGPAITSEEEDDYDPLPWANKGGFDFEDFQDTDLEGPGVEMAIDNLIADYDQTIKTSVPKELQYSARIAVKKLWLEKIKNWRS